MLIVEQFVDASLKTWGFIKVGAQILSYVGLVATTALGVFDFLFEHKGKVAGANDRLPLNPSGKKHVYFYVGIAFITLIATVFKDVADYKLSGRASELAKADLREALGDNLDSFATTALKPSLAAISNDIEMQRTMLNENIHQSTQVLDKALKKTGSEMNQSTAEAAADAELSDVKVDNFILSISTEPTTLHLKTMSPPATLQNYIKVENEQCRGDSMSDHEMQSACNKLKQSINQLTNLQSFVSLLDPSGTGSLSFQFELVSFSINVSIPLNCIPAPLHGAAAETQQCVQLLDVEGHMIYDDHVEVQQYGAYFPPRMTLHIPREKQPGIGPPATSLENVFGRNVRLNTVMIHADEGNNDFIQRLPKQIIAVEGLSVGDGRYFSRTYHLHLVDAHTYHPKSDLFFREPSGSYAFYARD